MGAGAGAGGAGRLDGFGDVGAEADTLTADGVAVNSEDGRGRREDTLEGDGGVDIDKVGTTGSGGRPAGSEA